MTQDKQETDGLQPETEQEETVGALLRRTRLAQKQDLQDIAAYLCIRYQFLDALENGRYKELPGDAYANGFVRSYAAHLGLNPADIVSRYKQEYLNRMNREKEIYVMTPQEAENIAPAPKVLLISVVLLAVAFGLWQTSFKEAGEVALPAVETPVDPITVVDQSYPLPEEPAPVEQKTVEEKKVEPVAQPVPPVPAVKPAYVEEKAPVTEKTVAETQTSEAQTAAVVEQTLAPAEQEAQPEPPKIYGRKNYNPRLVLVATKETWIEVTRGETVVFSRLLKAGDQYWVSSINPEELFLKTGNAGGLEIYCDGKLTQSLGESGVLRSNIALIPDDFAAKVVEDIE